MNKYRMQVYLGTDLAEGSRSLEGESLDEAEASAQRALKGTWIAMDDDARGRRVYCTAVVTGFVVSLEDGPGARKKIGLLS